MVPHDGDMSGYNANVDAIREKEYPMLKGKTYLDHAGTTLYAMSLIERFSNDMTSNLLGNPHSAFSNPQLSIRRIEDIRLRVLHFFNADPEDFDVVFVANTTAGIKLVMEAFRDHDNGFWYGYHKDSHTSLVGVRENATAGQRCFHSDAEVDLWLSGTEAASESSAEGKLGLFAYPAQSNMDGRRLPSDWLDKIRSSKLAAHRRMYSVLDAAAFVSTSPLDLGDPDKAPDFTVLSFYKIFGFPDLGALIVRKSSASILHDRKYFGGGTVEMVSCIRERWHIRKERSLHERLEDGTLPFHDIMALDGALDVHKRLYGSMENIARHAMALTQKLCEDLKALKHGNGRPVCCLYGDTALSRDNRLQQGPVVALNLRDSQGQWVSLAEVEKLASIKDIYLRIGGLCNPGGVASALSLTPWEMKRNFSAGQRCGNENDLLGGKPSGVIRISFGAMSNLQDVNTFINFIREFFVKIDLVPIKSVPVHSQHGEIFVESLTVYPIKSCGGWRIPRGMRWAVGTEGLAWDREWCLVHQGTGSALSQKRYPQMALIRPEIELGQGLLRVHRYDPASQADVETIDVPLSSLLNDKQENVEQVLGFRTQSAQVCGDVIRAQVYTSPEISGFFTRALGVQCTLARFPAEQNGVAQRHSKAQLQKHQTTARRVQLPGAFPSISQEERIVKTSISLSNESPILTISKYSLNRLNEQIMEAGGKSAQAEVFRANIIVAENPASMAGHGQPYAEDTWRYLRIGPEYFQILGSCRRCQMVCVDQGTAQRNTEPFVTLAKTRRFDGKVFFGQHTRHIPYHDGPSSASGSPTIQVGDPVLAFRDGDEVLDERLLACLRP